MSLQQLQGDCARILGLNNGEYAVAVRFLERESSDDTRMTFIPASPDAPVRLVNSSTLVLLHPSFRQATVRDAQSEHLPKSRKAKKAGAKAKVPRKPVDRPILSGTSEDSALKNCT